MGRVCRDKLGLLRGGGVRGSGFRTRDLLRGTFSLSEINFVVRGASGTSRGYSRGFLGFVRGQVSNRPLRCVLNR